MKVLLSALILLLVLGACSTRAVTMRHPATGATVRCGPFPTMQNYGSAQAAAMQEAQCIQDFKEQGYVRVGD